MFKTNSPPGPLLLATKRHWLAGGGVWGRWGADLRLCYTYVKPCGGGASVGGVDCTIRGTFWAVWGAERVAGCYDLAAAGCKLCSRVANWPPTVPILGVEEGEEAELTSPGSFRSEMVSFSASTSPCSLPRSVARGLRSDFLATSAAPFSSYFTLSFTLVVSDSWAFALFWADPSTAATLCSKA